MTDPATAPAPATAIKIRGEAWERLPEDLYIPPDALRVVLEAFEGPLDLLLYLIRRQNLDILDIPVAGIAAQYIAYIDVMRELEIELAGEYLLMAAMLAEIKSRMLLPRPAVVDADEGTDPRAELVRRLQEYEQIKHAAEGIDALPRVGRDTVPVQLASADITMQASPPEPELPALLAAFRDVMLRAELFTTHTVQREPLSVRARMSAILERLQGGGSLAFAALFPIAEGRLGVVVTFVAILELAREALVEMEQDEPLALLYLRVPGARSGRRGPDDILIEAYGDR